MRISASALGACLLMVAACAGASTPSSALQTTTTSVHAAATTSTSPPSSTTPEPAGSTSLQRLDEATLQPVGSPLTLPGYLADEHVALPDGRLLLFTFEGNDWTAIIFDPEANRIDSAAEAPFTGGVRPVGYSTELDKVVMIGLGLDTQHFYLFDPSTGSFSNDKLFDGEDIEWLHEAALIDGGRKVVVYETFGYDEARIGEPPQVRVGDLTSNVLGRPIEVMGVLHGHAELAPDAVRDPQWPYGEVAPGIVFDEVDNRLFVVHGDGAGLTTVDLLAGSSEVTDLVEPPSFWTSVMSWLIPPARAKGSEPSANLTAWLSHDGSQLLVTGETEDAWRDAENRLHTTQTALGLMVIDTETMDVARTLELPVNRGLSTRSAVVLTGSEGSHTWCDEVCKPGNNELEVEGEHKSSGLILLDPTSLEIRDQHLPGTAFNPLGVYEDWLVLETSSEDWWGFETVNLVSGQLGGRTDEVFGASYVMVTERGVYLNGQFGP